MGFSTRLMIEEVNKTGRFSIAGDSKPSRVIARDNSKYSGPRKSPVHRRLESRERLVLPWPAARRDSDERTLHRKSMGISWFGFQLASCLLLHRSPSRGLVS